MKYKIEDIGVDYPDYFNGRGVAFTVCDEVFVGIGNSPWEACEDALERASNAGWIVDEIPNTLSDVSEIGQRLGAYHYVAVYLRR